MSVELSNRNPGNAHNSHPNAVNKRVAEKKRRPKNFAEEKKQETEERQKNKLPLFYTIPIFKPNKYEFY